MLQHGAEDAHTSCLFWKLMAYTMRFLVSAEPFLAGLARRGSATSLAVCDLGVKM